MFMRYDFNHSIVYPDLHGSPRADGGREAAGKYGECDNVKLRYESQLSPGLIFILYLKLF